MSQTARPKAPRTGSFPNAWTAFHVRGVPIRIDWSWLVIAGLVVFFLFARFADLLDDHGRVVVVAAATAATLLFFASLLAHELGHAVTSLNRDLPVASVTLFLLGGVTESTEEAKTARDEFVIVGIGPFVSFVLAAAFGLAYTTVQPDSIPAVVLGYLAWLNLLLGIFNVLPGYPLDGGRLLRSVLWAVTKRPHRATRWAARIGQGFAVAVIGLGVFVFTQTAGSGLGGIWEVLIGVFLYRGAAQSHRHARMRERLGTRSVRQVMGSVVPTLDERARLADVVERVQERPTVPWPVGKPVAGVLTLDQINAVPRADWSVTTVGDVARRDGVTVDADAGMDVALDRLRSAPGAMLVVTDDGAAVGLLTPSLVVDERR